MPLTRSLCNSAKQNDEVQLVVQDKIEVYLERKFRTSRSFATRNAYRIAINRFIDFVRIHYNLDFSTLLLQIKESKRDPIDILDDYYSHLSEGEKRLSNSTICLYFIVAKDFLNSLGCKIYSEDIRQRFRLPKKTQVYEEGITKETINRIIRFSNPKLATAILMICSSGMRISEMVQLRLEDIDVAKSPTTIRIRAETAKTRETRITCISSEATNALQDYIERYHITSKFLFLKNFHETEEVFVKDVICIRQSLERQIKRVLENIPELNKKNENGRNAIHFHAFRAWFKTQVTDAHQSDFAESLMGHKSLKLVYYRQNAKARAETYLGIEHALTIADTEKIDENYSELQKDNLELRGIVDGLSKQLRNLEKRIVD